MGDVVQLHAERWVEVFSEAHLTVQVSTKGRVKFMTTGTEPWSTISMAQMMKLGQMLTEAYTDEEEDEDG